MLLDDFLMECLMNAKIKSWIIACSLCTGFLSINAQVAINSVNNLPDHSAMLDVSSTVKGILFPRLTTSQRISIQSPQNGLVVIDVDTKSFWFVKNSAWAQIPFDGSSFLLGGNAGTDQSFDFIGTTDDQPLKVRTNNELSAILAPGGIAFLGNNAGIYDGDTTNAGFGNWSLHSNHTGSDNTAIGPHAMQWHDAGVNNTAAGYVALSSNYGSSNTAIGRVALSGNYTGSGNVATGHGALVSNSTGSNNSAFGEMALNYNTSGHSNTSLGYESMYWNSEGNYNTAIGYQALYDNSYGCYNTFIGNYTNVTSDNFYNSTAIGYGSLVSASNEIRLGNDEITSLYCKGAYAATVPLYTNVNVNNEGRIMRAVKAFPTGSGNYRQVAFWNSSSTYTGNQGFTWDSLSNRLGIGTSNPGAQLTVSNAYTPSFRVSSPPLATGAKNLIAGAGSAGSLANGNFNTVLGDSALYSNSSGSFNLALGFSALYSNKSGNYDLAAGIEALSSNTTGTGNIALGSRALAKNISGNYNLAAGYMALFYNDFGGNNLAIGNEAMYSNTNGYNNVAIGDYSLFANYSGHWNISIGDSSMLQNTEGSQNKAIGTCALSSNLTGSRNIAIGDSAAVFCTGSDNCSVGNKSVYANTSGTGNIAIGREAVLTNETGHNNIGVGNNVMHSSANLNDLVAIGDSALNLNVSGEYCTALGSTTLYSHLTGNFNTAIGRKALSGETSGSCITAVGAFSSAWDFEDAGSTTVTGYYTWCWYGGGCILGYNARNYSINNTAIGSFAFNYEYNSGLVGGAYSTAVGLFSGVNNISDYSTFIGVRSGKNNGEEYTYYGSNIDCIGYYSEAINDYPDQEMAIGNMAKVGSANRIVIGNTSVTSIGGYANWALYSDVRLKENIVYRNDLGLNLILSLKPVSYCYTDDKNKVRRDGLIAQDVSNTLDSLGLAFSGLVIENDSARTMSLSYSSFVVPLITAVQEQQAQLRQDQELLNDIRAKVAMLEDKLGN